MVPRRLTMVIFLSLVFCWVFVTCDLSSRRDSPDSSSRRSDYVAKHDSAGWVIFRDVSRNFVVTMDTVGDSHMFRVENGPANVHGLVSSPRNLETPLTTGKWLILVAAVYSVPDVGQIGTAMRVAQEFGPSVNVGLRPFETSTDNSQWCAECLTNSFSLGTPIWVIVADGQIIAVGGGRMETGEVVGWFRNKLAEM